MASAKETKHEEDVTAGASGGAGAGPTAGERPAAQTEVLTWGCGNDGQLGLGREWVGRSAMLPQVVPTFSQHGITITKVSAGSRHVIALDSAGNAYAWGWGQCGQLGLGMLKKSTIPRKVPLDEHGAAVIISAGGCHSGFVTDKGHVLTCGDNSYGQLGLGEAAIGHNLWVPAAMDLSETLTEGQRVKDISFGGSHSSLLTSDGVMYAWGRGDNGQLGIGKAWLLSITETGRLGIGNPRRVKFAEGSSPVVQVDCGAFHTAAVTADGSLFTWGKEDHGMLGLHHGRDMHTPSRVDLPKAATHVACGGWHTMVVAEGTIYAFGRGEYGRLGLGDDRSRLAPTPLVGLKSAARVTCGGTHSLVRTTSGCVGACGRGDHGRLGQGDDTTSLSPVFVRASKEHAAVNTLLSNVTYVSAGGTFSVAVRTITTAEE